MKIAITQRQSALGLLGVLAGGSFILFLVLQYQVFINPQASQMLPLFAIASTCITSGLLVAYYRGWEYARHVTLVITVALALLALQEPFITQTFSITLFLPAALALVLAGPGWVIGSVVVLYGTVLIRAGGEGIYANPVTMLIFSFIVAGIVIGRLIADTAQHVAEENANRAKNALSEVARKASELEEANQLMNTQLDEQRKLLDLVTTLETPVVPLADGVLFAPLVGHLDSRRAQMVTTRLLHEAHEQRATLVVLDIAGVSVIDTAVAKSLLNTAQSLKLLGCEVTLSGISASVALTLIHLGVNLGVKTARSPQEALAQHLAGAVAARLPGNGKVSAN